MTDLLDGFDTYTAKLSPHGKTHAQRTHDDYSTPQYWANLVRKALGGSIACDPASTDVDNDQAIHAAIFYTAERSGLHPESAWPSPVYLNPPSALRKEFLARAAQEVKQGCEMIVCLNNKHLSATYFRPLRLHMTALSIPEGRIPFLHAGTRELNGSPTDGTVFVYCGPSPWRFVEVFSAIEGTTGLFIQPTKRRLPRPQATILGGNDAV